MVKCKYEGTGIWNGRCTGTKEVDPCLGYGKCKQYKPNYTTNADRIRSMSDEELAEFIDRCEMGDIDYAKTFCDLCNGQYECDQCRLDWLHQPAE